ncbi:hypothetical protein [Prochlorococcus sp. MIT 0604]|uniref:hypothetical protein n=1 Tax=Prochlorococcus sp. MIT 0604 TaxID=1501268 RepID=UPI0012E0A351|nr:hypothetical protein [Prochlorococcus sp. MIT 0604]
MGKLITSNNALENILIKFPLWFPLTYIFLALNFPSQAQLLFLSSLFLFAETHFASTWLFFMDKENWSWVKENFYKVVFLPIYVLLLTIIIWLLSPSVIIIIHYIASGWHVTKQSAGILKVYGIRKKIYEFSVYFSSLLFLSIGLKNPGILSYKFNINTINIYIFLLLSVYFLILIIINYDLMPKFIDDLLPIITGISIYLPLLFFKDLATATAIGVGMHWCQYLAIIWYSYLRKNKKNEGSKSNLISPLIGKILFIFSYSLIMTLFSIKGMVKNYDGNINFTFLYLVPIIFQLFHFYIDGYIWKFSDPHIRKSVLKYLYK